MKQATLESPVTGRLTVYNLHNFLDVADGFVVADPITFRDVLNDEYYAQGVDAICNEVKIISHPVATWIQVDNWIPAEVEGTTHLVGPIVAAILVILKVVIPLIITGIVVWGVGSAVHGWIMEQQYPSQYYTMPDPATGEVHGPWPRSQAYSWNVANYPDLWFDPTTLTPLNPSDPNFEERRDWVILNTPEGWGEPTGGGIENLIQWIIIGAVVIGGIIIVGPYLARLLTRKD